MSKNTKKKTINKAKILNNYVEIKLIERKQIKNEDTQIFLSRDWDVRKPF